MSQHKRGKREFQIALVGCGRISKNHFDAIRKVDGLELTAVADSSEERARAAGEEQGVPWYSSYPEMLRKAECDVVTIATPSGMHSAQGIEAARAGKHVITEKPMAITLEQADALVAATDAAGVRLFVVKQN
ncbi:MAG: Gfo/Idh/MocA family protein, partial [Gemmatimonadaceae bacterium]